MSRILSFDPGVANCGYGSVESNDNGDLRLGRFFGVLKTKPEDGTDRDRIDLLSVEVKRVLESYEPDAVGIEDWTYMGKRGKSESTMPALIENMRLLCKGLGVPCYLYENAQWKAKTLKSRGANKNQVKHYVGRRVPESAQVLHRIPDHAWDAVGICFAVLQDMKR